MSAKSRSRLRYGGSMRARSVSLSPILVSENFPVMSFVGRFPSRTEKLNAKVLSDIQYLCTPGKRCLRTWLHSDCSRDCSSMFHHIFVVNKNLHINNKVRFNFCFDIYLTLRITNWKFYIPSGYFFNLIKNNSGLNSGWILKLKKSYKYIYVYAKLWQEFRRDNTAENNTRFAFNYLIHGRYFTLKIIEALLKCGFICWQNGVQKNKTESLDTTSARVTFEPRVEITTISREGAHPIATVHADPPPSPGDRVASLPEKGK